MNVAPPTRTRSVTKNRVLAAAYAGAGRFGVEVFEPATTKTLMAALLVHDLEMSGAPAPAHPWEEEAQAAAHGGLWRIAYAPRSALTLAALLGYASVRKRDRGSSGSLPMSGCWLSECAVTEAAGLTRDYRPDPRPGGASRHHRAFSHGLAARLDQEA